MVNGAISHCCFSITILLPGSNPSGFNASLNSDLKNQGFPGALNKGSYEIRIGYTLFVCLISCPLMLHFPVSRFLIALAIWSVAEPSFPYFWRNSLRYPCSSSRTRSSANPYCLDLEKQKSVSVYQTCVGDFHFSLWRHQKKVICHP